MFIKSKVTTRRRPKEFDCTTTVYRLRTVSCSDCGHLTGVVNLDNRPNLHTSRKSCVINRTQIYISVYKPPSIAGKKSIIKRRCH